MKTLNFNFNSFSDYETNFLSKVCPCFKPAELQLTDLPCAALILKPYPYASALLGEVGIPQN